MRIVIEGPVGSGKTVVGTLIARMLRRMGYSVDYRHEDKDNPLLSFNARSFPKQGVSLDIVINEIDNPEVP